MITSKTTVLFIFRRIFRDNKISIHLIQTVLIIWHMNRLGRPVLSFASGSFGFFESVGFCFQVFRSSLVIFAFEMSLQIVIVDEVSSGKWKNIDSKEFHLVGLTRNRDSRIDRHPVGRNQSVD